MKNLLFTTAVFALFAVPVFAQSSDVREIKLCSGADGGVYDADARIMASYANSKVMKITNIQTEGTSDNMDRMLRGECDAMIAQPDGPVYWKATRPADAAKFAKKLDLHAENLKGLCNAESGIKNLSDLEDDPEKYTLAVGVAGSGAWLTWQNIVAFDDDYGKVPVKLIGGIDAVTSVSTGEVTCMLVASGDPNGTVAYADANFGDDVNVVGMDDGDANDAEDIDGKNLYKWVDVDLSHYKTTYSKYWSDVETIGWAATLYVNRETVSGKDLSNFLQIAARARVEIQQTYGKLPK